MRRLRPSRRGLRGPASAQARGSEEGAWRATGAPRDPAPSVPAVATPGGLPQPGQDGDRDVRPWRCPRRLFPGRHAGDRERAGLSRADPGTARDDPRGPSVPGDVTEHPANVATHRRPLRQRSGAPASHAGLPGNGPAPTFPLEALRKSCPAVNGISVNLNPTAGPQVIRGSVIRCGANARSGSTTRACGCASRPPPSSRSTWRCCPRSTN